MEASNWKHDALAEDLAAHLRGSGRMVWTDMQLGPSGSRRPDVYTIAKSYTRPSPLAYECKVSRADFLRDVQAGKFHEYLAFASAVIFAAPKGLVAKKEIPAGCGLIERCESGWRASRGPSLAPVQIPQSAWLKLLIDGLDRLPARIRPREISAWQLANRDRKELGRTVARVAADLVAAEREVRTAKAAADAEWDRLSEAKAKVHAEVQEYRRSLHAEHSAAWSRICAVLGVPETSSANVVRVRLRNLEDRLNEESGAEAVEAAIDGAIHVLRSLKGRARTKLVEDAA